MRHCAPLTNNLWKMRLAFWSSSCFSVKRRPQRCSQQFPHVSRACEDAPCRGPSAAKLNEFGLKLCSYRRARKSWLPKFGSARRFGGWKKPMRVIKASYSDWFENCSRVQDCHRAFRITFLFSIFRRDKSRWNEGRRASDARSHSKCGVHFEKFWALYLLGHTTQVAVKWISYLISPPTACLLCLSTLNALIYAFQTSLFFHSSIFTILN